MQSSAQQYPCDIRTKNSKPATMTEPFVNEEGIIKNVIESIKGIYN